ncbi:MAG: S1 RNA-binding domain-containing protein, partial [Oscillospiraceae bacterium]|nr:S1 RNA-binding domain-containing protein [Oscillospiraceae bacterium]
MALEVGAIMEGKVTGITKFGAFVAMPEGKSGLVHISEVANSFVSDVHDHVQIGQTVKVKVLAISEE